MWKIRKIKQQQEQKQTITIKTPPSPPPTKKKITKTKTTTTTTTTTKRDPVNFSEWFFTCSLPVSSSKTLEHNPFTLFKLCYLLDAIFF